MTGEREAHCSSEAQAFRRIAPDAVPAQVLYRFLAGGIGPRPIALVATVSPAGAVNLAPYSFFNLFSIAPPVVGFSILKRMRDGSDKDTYRNLLATGECTIQAVTHAMLYRQSIAAADYPPEVDETVKAGLTPIPAERVTPPLIAESPFRMECVLREMIALGDGGGAGQLALCSVVRLHVSEAIVEGDRIDAQKIDLVGRLGGDDYARANGDAVTAVRIPGTNLPPGLDEAPSALRRRFAGAPEALARLALEGPGPAWPPGHNHCGNK